MASPHDSKGETIDGSGSALRLLPIRGSMSGYQQQMQMQHGYGARPTLPTMMEEPLHSAHHQQQQEPTRRASQDEIRALLQRTTLALDKIVKIRESMEPFVDFTQFAKPRGTSATSSTSSTFSVAAPGGSSLSMSSSSSTSMSRRLGRTSSGFSDAPIAESMRLSRNNQLTDSYVSSTEGDPLGDRSTGSTESTSSIEDDADGSPPEGNDRGIRYALEGSTVQEGEHEDDDDDDDSSFSSVDEDELPPTKEARMDRLRSVTILFHEGLPAEFFMVLTRFLYSAVELKTRHSRFNFYKDAFVGCDAIREMITSGFAEDQSVAQRYGNVMVKLGFIEHVSRTDDQLHNSKESFYRFTRAVELDEDDGAALPTTMDRATRVSINAGNYRESVLPRESLTNVEYDFDTASDEVHALVTEETLVIIARVLHMAFERKNKLLFYKGFVGCFLGAEAVTAIREMRVATSLIDAVLIGQALLDDKIIEPIATTVNTFQDKYVFYRLTQVPS